MNTSSDNEQESQEVLLTSNNSNYNNNYNSIWSKKVTQCQSKASQRKTRSVIGYNYLYKPIVITIDRIKKYFELLAETIFSSLNLTGVIYLLIRYRYMSMNVKTPS